MKLHNLRILLTGASGGIGSELARQLAEQQNSLILLGRDLSALEKLRRSLPNPEQHQCLSVDLTDQRQILALASADELQAGIDILINNAGTSHFAWLEDQSPHQINAQLSLNLSAPILLTRTLLPSLHRPGKILNVGSSFGGIGYPGYSVYCAAKFGLHGFSQALARELHGSGIDVCYIAPRATRTDLNSPAVYAMNAELGNHTDSVESVAAAVINALQDSTRSRWLGWPEKLFVRINALLPRVVDRAIAARHAVIARYARQTLAPILTPTELQQAALKHDLKHKES
ncbi:SDR family oxidoreductase [Plesiomonas shigelloides]|uniref:SDR family oxidoreductase n=1 Tax=Plesiomonas shigelloides TaxID=703 RepID=UPI001261749B|nr:SDR family oxidoreductase [Plesiomonas shigelloides]KAB7703302.1 SDR family oxidoreductase [Plesiomonas shigelloides]